MAIEGCRPGATLTVLAQVAGAAPSSPVVPGWWAMPTSPPEDAVTALAETPSSLRRQHSMLVQAIPPIDVLAEWISASPDAPLRWEQLPARYPAAGLAADLSLWDRLPESHRANGYLQVNRNSLAPDVESESMSQ